eukprot:717018-Prymnesium_polylepis.1
MADDDPHGTRGSTVHHALDYKKEVKSFSSADILAAFKAGNRGEVDRGVPSQPSTKGSASDAPPVKSFNSADLAANISQAKAGGPDTLSSKPAASTPASASASASQPGPPAGPPAERAPSGETGVKVRRAAACSPACSQANAHGPLPSPRSRHASRSRRPRAPAPAR